MAVPAAGGPALYLAPLIGVTLLLLRNARHRRLRVERLWIAPLVVLVFAVAALAVQPPPDLVAMLLCAAALPLGALAGWWRGRLTRIVVDPKTHELASRASPIGMVLILAVFALRYGLRSFSAETAQALHIPLAGLVDALMLLAVGLVCAQRLEVALRANRLLNEARSGA
jgi:hypothetical protein